VNRAALFVSPHLDDVAFSCGGTLIRLIREGWQVRLCTVFTASVVWPQGFALACQLDKGLSADMDYMALRRMEDDEFARLAGVADSCHLNFMEAPHRGYRDAADLFLGVHHGDEVWRELAGELTELAQDCGAIFAPQGLGNHVDHLQVILALQQAGLSDRAVWYTDTPYAIRFPSACPSPLLSGDLKKQSVTIELQRKIEGCRAYRTQVPFQFGSEERMERKLVEFHGRQGGYSETFLTDSRSDFSSLV
jgi:LmbE family N-acetylglucosaminyl deacetylase